MNFVFVALNSSFTHTALALHSLKQSVSQIQDVITDIIELTINTHYDDVIAEIFLHNPDILCFSCYIWNIKYIETLVKDIKKILPKVLIICGGPEVSYDTVDFLHNNHEVDYVISGESEKAFPELVKSILKKSDGNLPNEVAYRKGSTVVLNTAVGVIHEPDELCFPYDIDYIKKNNRKIFYYETSRGCPYSCSYCISSIDKSYRRKSLGKVFDEIKIFTDCGVNIVKFTDRTFNADKKRACEILTHIAALNTKTLFHLEIAADTLDNDIIDIINNMPVARIQLEAGIQSTNKDTLKAICRSISYDKSAENLGRIISKGNVHVHTDLIAGLPFETFESFGNSFDDVYKIGGHKVQLGFLKLLKGTAIRYEYDKNKSGYTYFPPYEILNTPWLEYKDLLRLKNTEIAVEKYHNSQNYTLSLEYIFKQGLYKPFEFFLSLGEFMKNNGFLQRPISALECFDIFESFINQEEKADRYEKDIIHCILKLDLVSSFVFRKIPQQYKDKIGYTLIKQESESDIKTYMLDELSIRVFNSLQNVFTSTGPIENFLHEQDSNNKNGETVKASPSENWNPINVVRIDYSNKDSVTGRYNSQLITYRL